jgi:hypothetical protein
LDYAIPLAETYDAHLDVLCLSVNRTHAWYYYAGASTLVFQEAVGHSHEKADQLEQIAQIGFGSGSFDGPWIKACSNFPIWHDRYLHGRGFPISPFYPYPMVTNPRPELIMIGWNETTEALNAVRTSLPLL